MTSTLTTSSSSQIILANGAQSSNTFWAVGSSATLGTSSVFKGTIMANQSIIITTGAELDGRALTRVASYWYVVVQVLLRGDSSKQLLEK
jgi:hypothetical protein